VDEVNSEAPSGVVPALLAKPLVFVTGKGGAGKTTVAAVLGVAAASSGLRSIVCELGGAQQLPDAFGRHGDVRVRPSSRQRRCTRLRFTRCPSSPRRTCARR
jgi:CO dehydrogenase nickel-insertion accessory protein CooC1